MAEYTPITCSDYDVLEVVCTFGYRIDLTLDDERVVGTAVTLQTDPPGEYLIILMEGGDTSRIRIDRIQSLVVLDRPARFEAHVFASSQA